MRTIEIHPHQPYHIYNRGVNKQLIFYHASDWELFLAKMHRYFKRENVQILAYCLMPNHYHLLVNILCENFGNLVMQPFLTSFSKTVNLRNKRIGPLFQGPFQAKKIDTDQSLLEVTRYIHMNPVVAGMVDSPEEWKYSSYNDFLSGKDSIIAVSEILEYFTDINDFSNFSKSK